MDQPLKMLVEVQKQVDDLPDELWFEFIDDDAGPIDLGAGGQENYETCTHCVTSFVDIDAENEAYGSDLFQASGTLEIDAATPLSGLAPTITLTNLRLITVTIDSDTLESTPVAGAPCYDVGTVTLETEAQ